MIFLIERPNVFLLTNFFKNMEEGKNVCKCSHHKMVPGLIVVFGLVFLLGALGVLSSNAVSIAWPIVVIAAGAMKMMEGMCKCC